MSRYWFVAAVALLAATAQAATYDLTIGKTPVNFTGQPRQAITVNGQLPAPLLRFQEGEEVVLNVTNALDTDSSLHWHGFILPYTMDGAPGFGFAGIKPGETFSYRFKIQQSGTYWYHSHSDLQEQAGLYGPIIIEPTRPEPYKYDRDYVIMLSDWTDQAPRTVMSKLKKQSDYYNYSQQTVADFFREANAQGWDAALQNRLDWGQMRMMATDIADVAGYTFLVNGRTPEQNWSGLFKPGERVRLRLINGSAMSIFDVRIPGLKMTVVQADGNNVTPTPVDELRISVAETYDVIVQPQDDQAYTLFAESLDRTGYARATLAPREGMSGEVPALRPRPLLTMADMAGHGGMDHGSMAGMDHDSMAGMDTEPVDHSKMDHSKMNQAPMAGMDHSSMNPGGAANAAQTPADMAKPNPRSGLYPKAANDGKFLIYNDLRAMSAYPDYRAPDREIEIRLTGNMERYIWTLNDEKFVDAEPIRLKYGERVRFKLTNTTMMNHPIHLHGMWMQLDIGKGAFNPLKHVVNVMPGQTVYVEVPVDAKGEWPFHCHLLYHMHAGMMRKVIVDDGGASI
ncbi:MAG TPA: copper resistance system multicopper oxidase [Candidatus Competibacteraceae bacterium]|nr:copper resistance system multicopper oxidase [Candidatus Competibacteraceae bacterium]